MEVVDDANGTDSGIISGNTSGPSPELEAFYEHPLRKLLLISAHTFTLSCLAAFAKMMHAKVEIKHPIFAVIFQQILVFGCCECVCFTLRLALLADGNLPLFEPIMAIWVNMQQLHQITWLVVTFLRYHILFRAGPSLDVQTLTPKSICSVWILWLLQSVLFSLAWFSSISAKGWPDVKLEEIDWTYWEMAGQFAMANLPDVGSILLYLWMLKCLRARASVQDNNPAQGNKESTENHHNDAVWVGPSDQDSRGSLEEDIAIEINVQPSNQAEESNEEAKIIKKLSVHILLSLVDFFALLLFRVFVLPSHDQILAHVLIYVYSYVFCIWLPLLVVKVNCKNLDGMLQYVISLIFGV